jgi:hypothetical protein
VARAISRIIFKNQGVLLEFYGRLLDFAERQGGLSVKWWGFFLVRIYFSMEIAVDSVHHPWTVEMPVHGGLAVAG